MPEVCSQPQRSYRLVRRVAPQRRPELTLRPLWPSMFTTQPMADGCVVEENNGRLAVYVGDRLQAVLRGTALDCFSLHCLLDRLRLQPPRPRS